MEQKQRKRENPFLPKAIASQYEKGNNTAYPPSNDVATTTKGQNKQVRETYMTQRKREPATTHTHGPETSMKPDQKLQNTGRQALQEYSGNIAQWADKT